MEKRILTGDRPTGKLHLGHYVGSLKNRVKLQRDYETFILVADVQALTDNFSQPEKVRENVREVAMDNLAVGLDPQIATIFIQSMIPEIAELTVYYMNLVTLSRLQRNPTVKSEMKERGFGADVPIGFLSYPVSQAADITIVRANLVPVGADQLPMIEQTREIVRKFNEIYGYVFPEPEPLVSEIPRLCGIDGGAKMSKSLGNVINLADPPEVVEQQVMKMYTDPTRIHQTDPGHIEGNVVFIYHDVFNADRKEVEEMKRLYKKGQIGDVEVKKRLTKVLNDLLGPIRERRKKLEKNPKIVDEILEDGTKRAKREAEKTLGLVEKAMRLDYFSS
jgi:tryptophanyl-tRNA synthetase